MIVHRAPLRIVEVCPDRDYIVLCSDEFKREDGLMTSIQVDMALSDLTDGHIYLPDDVPFTICNIECAYKLEILVWAPPAAALQGEL